MQKGFINIIIIIVAIVLIGAGGYFFAQKQLQTPEVACTMEAKLCPDGSYVGRTAPNCEFAPCPTEKENQEEDTTADWETYRNEEYGFEVKYPEDWYVLYSQYSPGGPIYQKATEKTDGHIIFSPMNLELCNECSMDDEAWMSIIKENGSYFIENSEVVDDFWDKLGKNNKVTGELVNKFVEKKIINGVEFIFFEQYNFNREINKKVWTPQMLFMYDKDFFWVRGNIKMSTILFDQILSTFKFID